jgi:uncharacterized iron-regulated membrane protein
VSQIATARALDVVEIDDVVPPSAPRRVDGTAQPTAPRRRRGLWAAVRATLFWAHLVTGVVAGAVVLIMSATGVLLTYQRQMTAWAAGAVTVPAGAARLPLDTLVARARGAVDGARVTGVTLRADPAAPVAIGVEPRRTVLVDPYTGAVMAGGPRLRAFFSEVERWHRSLAVGPSVRAPLGVQLTGASNLAFLFLLGTGLVLWWPRRVTWRSLRAVLVPNVRARGRARDWNWHHVLGLWNAPVLILVVGSAALISYQWPGALITRALGGTPARPEAPRARTAPGAASGGERRGGESRGGADAGPAFAANLDSTFAHAAAAAPGWQSLQLRMPPAGEARATLTASATASNRPDGRTQVTVDASTGAVVRTQPYAKLPTAQKVRAWVRPLHTGEAGGVIGQTLAGVASLSGVVLVWTGLALTWRRFRNRWLRRAAAPA